MLAFVDDRIRGRVIRSQTARHIRINASVKYKYSIVGAGSLRNRRATCHNCRCGRCIAVPDNKRISCLICLGIAFGRTPLGTARTLRCKQVTRYLLSASKASVRLP